MDEDLYGGKGVVSLGMELTSYAVRRIDAYLAGLELDPDVRRDESLLVDRDGDGLVRLVEVHPRRRR